MRRTKNKQTDVLKKSTLKLRFVIWRTICVFVWLLIGSALPSCSKNSQEDKVYTNSPAELPQARALDAGLTADDLDLSLPDKALEYVESPSRLEQLNGANEAGSFGIESSQAADNKNKSKNKVSISPSLEWADDSLPTVSGGEIILQRQLEN